EEKVFRHGPTLPPGRPGSTIGAGGLNGRVRNGNGCGPSARRTGKRENLCLGASLHLESCTGQVYVLMVARSSPRPISTGWLRTLLSLHLRPIHLVIYKGSYSLEGMGDLILRGTSRLDAFSAYSFRTWLSSRAPGGTTGVPAVRSPRSSRTRGDSSQISCARGR